MKVCAECGQKIDGSFLKICDNFLQVHFFSELDGSDNLFCSSDCLMKALSVKEFEIEEGGDA
jgi:hypothetical protein